MHLFFPLVLIRVALLWTLLVPAAWAATPLDLPDLEAMVDYRPKIPLRVYTSDGALIGDPLIGEALAG